MDLERYQHNVNTWSMKIYVGSLSEFLKSP